MRQWTWSALFQIMACRLFACDLLSIGPLGTKNFGEIWIKIQNFSFKKMHLKTSSAKRRPFCPGGIQCWTFVWMFRCSLCLPHQASFKIQVCGIHVFLITAPTSKQWSRRVSIYRLFPYTGANHGYVMSLKRITAYYRTPNRALMLIFWYQKLFSDIRKSEFLISEE